MPLIVQELVKIDSHPSDNQIKKKIICILLINQHVYGGLPIAKHKKMWFTIFIDNFFLRQVCTDRLFIKKSFLLLNSIISSVYLPILISYLSVAIKLYRNK